MQKEITLIQLLPALRQVLDEGEEYTFSPRGLSMRPMLYGNKCTVTLKKPSGRLRKYDLPLYQVSDGSVVLHRVVKVCKDSYIMRGDSVVRLEKGITDKQIIGVVCAFTRKDRSYSVNNPLYRAYCVIWTAFPILRRFVTHFGKKEL